MIHVEEQFAGAQGALLYMQAWVPEEPARAHLAIVHGLAEHSGRYSHIVQRGVAERYGVWGFDLRGHGRSAGKPGHINAWSEYQRDLAIFLRLIADRHPGAPLFVLGHSLGALIVLDFIESPRPDLSGAILSGAPIEPAGVAKPHLVALARVLSRVWPTFVLNPGLKGSQLARDPEVAAAYESDPLVHVAATTRWGTECLAALARVKAHPEGIRLPVMFVHGEDDPINRPSGTRAFFEQIPLEDKQLRVYANSLHEAHNDFEAAQVAGDVFEWIGAHLAAPAAA